MTESSFVFKFEASTIPCSSEVLVENREDGSFTIYNDVSEIETGFINGQLYHRVICEDGTRASFRASDFRIKEREWVDIL